MVVFTCRNVKRCLRLWSPRSISNSLPGAASSTGCSYDQQHDPNGQAEVFEWPDEKPVERTVKQFACDTIAGIAGAFPTLPEFCDSSTMAIIGSPPRAAFECGQGGNCVACGKVGTGVKAHVPLTRTLSLKAENSLCSLGWSSVLFQGGLGQPTSPLCVLTKQGFAARWERGHGSVPPLADAVEAVSLSRDGARLGHRNVGEAATMPSVQHVNQPV